MLLLRFVLLNLLRRPRTWIIALLSAGVAALLVFGAAVVGSIYEGTQRSVIESGAGQFQLFNPKSPTRPPEMGGVGGQAELYPIEKFDEVAALVKATPGVKHFLPMENGAAEVFRGNYLDERLKVLRAVVRLPESDERTARMKVLEADLRRVLKTAVENDARREALFVAGTHTEDREALRRSASDEFWQDFEKDPLAALEFLENHVASQLGEGDSMTLGYIATDINRFFEAFSRVEMVLGQKPLPNHRGLLMGHAFYEKTFKLAIAYRLDQLSRELARGQTIADEPELKTLVERNLAEADLTITTLDAERAGKLNAALEPLVGAEGDLLARFKRFLQMDDSNFQDRYKAFYDRLAPELPLYRLRPGDVIALRSYGDNTGVRVRFEGTIRFKGLGSEYDKVNELNLIDPLSAMYLASRTTQAQIEESEAFIKEKNIPEIPTDDSLTIPAVTDVEAVTGQGNDYKVKRAPDPAEVYEDKDALAAGVLQAAIVLDDGVQPEAFEQSLLATAQTKGLSIALASWREVGGIVSDAISLSRILLGVAAGILGLVLFLVTLGALVVMSTERVGEVGTLRAIGMQRSETLLSFTFEGVILGAGGALLGVLASGALVLWLSVRGIGVSDSSLQFFLGGAVLKPHLTLGAVLGVELLVAILVTLASLWPAIRGAMVEPRVAMSRGEL